MVDDIVQETFIVAFRKGVGFLSHPNPKAYLYMIARGKARDWSRADQSRSAREVRWYRSAHRHSIDSTALLAGDLDVRLALAELSSRQREAVYLRHCADLSLSDVANIMDISIGAAGAHLHRAERNLDKLLNGDPEGSDREAE